MDDRTKARIACEGILAAIGLYQRDALAFNPRTAAEAADRAYLRVNLENVVASLTLVRDDCADAKGPVPDYIPPAR